MTVSLPPSPLCGLPAGRAWVAITTVPRVAGCGWGLCIWGVHQVKSWPGKRLPGCCLLYHWASCVRAMRRKISDPTQRRKWEIPNQVSTCVCVFPQQQNLLNYQWTHKLSFSLLYRLGGIVDSSFLRVILNLKEITFKYCLPCLASPHLHFSSCGSWIVGIKDLRGTNSEEWGWRAEQTQGHKGLDAWLKNLNCLSQLCFGPSWGTYCLRKKSQFGFKRIVLVVRG